MVHSYDNNDGLKEGSKNSGRCTEEEVECIWVKQLISYRERE